MALQDIVRYQLFIIGLISLLEAKKCSGFMLTDNSSTYIGTKHDLDNRYVLRRLLNTSESPGETTTLMRERSQTFWEKIDEFYSDNNNMATYCVLPILVLTYGGCCSVYCCWKCRRLLKRKRHKKLREENSSVLTEEDGNNCHLDNYAKFNNHPLSEVPSNEWVDKTGYVLQDKRKTPLPWDSPNTMNTDIDSATELFPGTNSTSVNYNSRQNLVVESEKIKRKAMNETVRQTTGTDREVFTTTVQENDSKYFAHFPKETTSGHNRKLKPVNIVPISKTEYQQHVDAKWDPLHNRPFKLKHAKRRSSDSRSESVESGRETAWSIRDEIMAKYDALSSIAMSKQTANVLRATSGHLDAGHRPDVERKRPGHRNKLIFIAE